VGLEEVLGLFFVLFEAGEGGYLLVRHTKLLSVAACMSA
jgi:hypothetical protein